MKMTMKVMGQEKTVDVFESVPTKNLRIGTLNSKKLLWRLEKSRKALKEVQECLSSVRYSVAEEEAMVHINNFQKLTKVRINFNDSSVEGVLRTLKHIELWEQGMISTIEHTIENDFVLESDDRNFHVQLMDYLEDKNLSNLRILVTPNMDIRLFPQNSDIYKILLEAIGELSEKRGILPRILNELKYSVKPKNTEISQWLNSGSNKERFVQAINSYFSVEQDSESQVTGADMCVEYCCGVYNHVLQFVTEVYELDGVSASGIRLAVLPTENKIPKYLTIPCEIGGNSVVFNVTYSPTR